MKVATLAPYLPLSDFLNHFLSNFARASLISGTLNGLYLWLCLKQFNKKNFAKVRPLVNILLASNCLSESELYEVVSIAGAVSSRETFQKYMCQLKPLLAGFSGDQLGLYHPSLGEWFTQVKI